MVAPVNEKARAGVASPATGHNQYPHPQFTPSAANDQRLLRLDFISDVGDTFISLGAAIAAAASAERLDLLELALRQSRASLLEAIAEFKALAADSAGGGE